jgi:predicted RNA methylase
MEEEAEPNERQTKGLKRNTIDKYYTKKNIVELCINIIKQKISISKTKDLIIEPSAGNGAFIPFLKKLCNKCRFYDIKPEHSTIIQQNFLDVDHTEFQTQNISKIHIIGNPPFGRQSSMAIKFIKKSSEFCNSISFILPKSFKKDSLRKHFPLQFHLIHEEDLPEKAFLIDGAEYNVDTVLQIWEKKDVEREDMKRVAPVSFTFVKKTDDHDISFRRVGVYAGKIDTDTRDKSIQSHYFIKFLQTTDSLDDIIKKLNTITYPNNNTVGPKSISKQELILEFNRML